MDLGDDEALVPWLDHGKHSLYRVRGLRIGYFIVSYEPDMNTFNQRLKRTEYALPYKLTHIATGICLTFKTKEGAVAVADQMMLRIDCSAETEDGFVEAAMAAFKQQPGFEGWQQQMQNARTAEEVAANPWRARRVDGDDA